LPLDDVRRVFQDDKNIYPLDNAEEKRKFLDLIIKLDLITLSTDPQGQLEGFLISYRSWDGDFLSRERPEVLVGNSIVVDVLWMKEGLGVKAIRKLIRQTLAKNKLVYAGAEKLFLHKRHALDNETLSSKEIKRGEDIFRAYDYPKFFRNYI
jgi:hypothetical protein